MASITIKDLSLSFDSQLVNSNSLKELFSRRLSRQPNQKKIVLKNISLNIAAGDRIGIIGSNGAGKSTFLKALCNIYEHYSGSIKINGTIASLLEVGAGFIPELTGRENITLYCAILGLKKIDIGLMEEDIISFSGLSEAIDQPVKYYSTGMYMRLAFTIATSIKPEILILDEVFSGGDQYFIKKGKQRLQHLIDKAGIVIMVSHDLDFLRSSCSRVLLMKNGSIIKDGPADEIIAFYKSEVV